MGKLTPQQIGETISNSEHYAAGRMTHAIIARQQFDQVQSEIVHDAIMAAFQAGYLSTAEGTDVTELLSRMAELD